MVIILVEMWFLTKDRYSSIEKGLFRMTSLMVLVGSRSG